jgi:hypothetical protein
MEELSELFKLVAEEKKKKKLEIESLVGDSFEKLFIEQLQPKKKKNIPEKIQEPQIVEVVEVKKDTLIEKSLGLLSEPSDTKHKNDPITPLDQKFATLEDLNKHYSSFLSRIQQQLSTLGGGGETNLTYMDVPVTSVTSSSYTIRPQDYYIGVNYAGAVTITLPRADREGKIFIVKDELGEASKGTNRYITVLPTGLDLIDGRDRAILAFDFGSLTFIWKSNSWRVV